MHTAAAPPQGVQQQLRNMHTVTHKHLPTYSSCLHKQAQQLPMHTSTAAAQMNAQLHAVAAYTTALRSIWLGYQEA